MTPKKKVDFYSWHFRGQRVSCLSPAGDGVVVFGVDGPETIKLSEWERKTLEAEKLRKNDFAFHDIARVLRFEKRKGAAKFRDPQPWQFAWQLTTGGFYPEGGASRDKSSRPARIPDRRNPREARKAKAELEVWLGAFKLHFGQRATFSEALTLFEAGQDVPGISEHISGPQYGRTTLLKVWKDIDRDLKATNEKGEPAQRAVPKLRKLVKQRRDARKRKRR